MAPQFRPKTRTRDLMSSSELPKPLTGLVECKKTEIANRLLAARRASYDASRTSNSIRTSSLALMPAFPGGLIPKSVCLTVVWPV
jgi:hypothetical protein